MKYGYRIELKLNNTQRTVLQQFCNTFRFVYNKGLYFEKEHYSATGRFLFSAKQQKMFQILRDTIPEYNFLSKYPSSLVTQALRRLDKSLNFSFAHKFGFPKYKRKHSNQESFTISGCVYVKTRYVRIPKIGKLQFLNPIEFDLNISQVTIKREGAKWFVSFSREINKDEITSKSLTDHIGIDVGLTPLLTCSDGTVYDHPRFLRKSENELKKLQRKLSKKTKRSKNYEKLRLKLFKKHQKIKNQRKDNLHKITSHLTKTKSSITVETLNIKGMMKNHCLAKSIADASWGLFFQYLEYKGSWYDCEIKYASRFYASSKTCSSCGHKKDKLSLKERIYKCEHCGLSINRDLNAAINLSTVGSTESNASGDLELSGSLNEEAISSVADH